MASFRRLLLHSVLPQAITAWTQSISMTLCVWWRRSKAIVFHRFPIDFPSTHFSISAALPPQRATSLWSALLHFSQSNNFFRFPFHRFWCRRENSHEFIGILLFFHIRYIFIFSLWIFTGPRAFFSFLLRHSSRATSGSAHTLCLLRCVDSRAMMVWMVLRSANKGP